MSTMEEGSGAQVIWGPGKPIGKWETCQSKQTNLKPVEGRKGWETIEFTQKKISKDTKVGRNSFF